jgi:malic enzyme
MNWQPARLGLVVGCLPRVYAQYRRQPDDLAKDVFLANMRDRNEVLFYRLLAEHLEEMLPIVYTPTVGKAIERYSHEYRRPRGVFLSANHPEHVEESLRNYGLNGEDVDLLVATDSEGIVDRPIIMPLSNPTSKTEAVPQDLIRWTDGRALVATGSPFPPVNHGGQTYTSAQANNALVFPGLGLAVAVVRAQRITDDMIAAAADTIAALAHPTGTGAALLPPVTTCRPSRPPSPSR